LIGALLAMPRITISYRRDDSLDITGRIFDRLAGHFGREAVFRDIDSIPPGADFRRHIDRVLDESDIILAIVGPRWIGPDDEQSRLANPADLVRLEIETALRKDKPLIPVLVSRAAMPQPEALPDSLHDFIYRHAVQVDSGQDFDVHLGRLIRAIDRIVTIDEAPAADQAGQGVTAAIEAVARMEPTSQMQPPAAPVPRASIARKALMDTVWTFLRKPSNQRLLAWLGGGVVVIVGGIWAVVIYVWPPHEGPRAVCAEQGIAIGGKVSGSTINNTVSGGTATAGPCVTSGKK
jgi:hypothetical protein